MSVVGAVSKVDQLAGRDGLLQEPVIVGSIDHFDDIDAGPGGTFSDPSLHNFVRKGQAIDEVARLSDRVSPAPHIW